MDPLAIAALIAGTIVVGILAANSAAAAIPRVTAFSVVTVPTQGLNGLWDLWVTGLNGLQGQAMMALIPGGMQNPSRNYLHMIYIPAALVAAQPTNQDWTYTFVPRGQTQSFTIIVPAAILQQYAATPKNAILSRMLSSFMSQMSHPEQALALRPDTGCSPQVVLQAIVDATYLITGQDVNGHHGLGDVQGGTFDQASDKAGWLSNNMGLIASTVQEIVTASDCASSLDQNDLNTLKGKIIAFGVSAGVDLAKNLGQQLFSSLSSGATDQSATSDLPHDFQSDAPSDAAPTDAAPTDTAPTDTAPTDQPSDTTTA